MLDVAVNDINCEVSRDPLPLVKEDAHHPSLSLLCNIKADDEKPFTVSELSTAYNFKRANFVGLYNALIYTTKYVKRNRKYPVWYSKEIIRNIKTENNL
nr:unnamed protein product [Callosobruchus analis]